MVSPFAFAFVLETDGTFAAFVFDAAGLAFFAGLLLSFPAPTVLLVLDFAGGFLAATFEAYQALLLWLLSQFALIG